MPSDVQCIRHGPSLKYTCPDCGVTVLQGIIQRGRERELSPIRPPDRVPDHLRTIPMSISYGTWEMWWTDRLYLVRIHGKQVAGDDALVEYVADIRDLYDERETR